MKYRGIIAALLLLLTLTACGGAEGKAPLPEEASSLRPVETASGDGSGEAKYVGFRVEEIPIEGKLGEIQSLCASENQVYFLSSVKAGENTVIDGETGEPYTFDIKRTGIFCADLENLSVSELEDFEMPAKPDGYSSDAGVSSIQVGPDGSLWLLYNLYIYDYDPDSPPEEAEYAPGQQVWKLLHLSSTGGVQEEIALPFAEYGTEVRAFLLDAEGWLYIRCGQEIHVLDPAGTEVASVACEHDGSTLCRYAGEIGVWYREAEPFTGDVKLWVTLLDTETLTWQAPTALPSSFRSFQSGSSGYDIYYQSSQNGSIHGYTAAQDDRLIDWLAFGMDYRTISAYVPLSDGSVLAALFDGGERAQDRQASLVLMQKTEDSGQKERTCLKLACYEMENSLIDPVLDFNRTNEQCYIEVVDYSDYDSGDGTGEGLTLLTTEILAGNVPDLFYTDNLPVMQYARQGILLDLYSCMDADPARSRDDFVKPLLDALEVQGALYELPNGFSVETLFGLESVVGDFKSWSAPELERVMARLQPDATVLGTWYTREQALALFSGSFEAFIDWENGNCSFESEDFLNLLELIKSFPEEEIPSEDAYLPSNARLVLKQQLLLEASIDSFVSYVYNCEPCGETAFVGYPGLQGAGRFVTHGSMAISAACAEKEQAWEFLTAWVDQTSVCFPVYADELHAKMEEAMETTYRQDPDGNLVIQNKTSYNHINEFGQVDAEISVSALTQEQVDAVMQLIQNTYETDAQDETLQTIVVSELEPFFDGVYTAAQTAALIQNRVELYVAEQGSW